MDLFAITPADAVFEYLKKGGFFIYPLIFCSFAGLAAIGFKAMSLTRARIVPQSLAKNMESAKSVSPEQLTNQLERGGSTLARLGLIAAKNHGKTEPEITRAVEAAAREEIVRMHSGIGVLDVVITVAPLLGLLGTASGLVVIFQGLGETTDHLAIALGIAQALNTTIFGLAIAVPAVIAHSYFSRRIESLTARMEAVLAGFVAICAKPQK
ncbi:MotA/TolQ/ExbB proton channel family protein [Luteolibacter sp. AS25]|uniref:MotA/TolQ/ExbB proton channel family protein n=1 Tax=Luteolibacter sp. AS25 TaxID=3135776 RepID=UPI00398B0413